MLQFSKPPEAARPKRWASMLSLLGVLSLPSACDQSAPKLEEKDGRRATPAAQDLEKGKAQTLKLLVDKWEEINALQRKHGGFTKEAAQTHCQQMADILSRLAGEPAPPHFELQAKMDYLCERILLGGALLCRANFFEESGPGKKWVIDACVTQIEKIEPALDLPELTRKAASRLGRHDALLPVPVFKGKVLVASPLLRGAKGFFEATPRSIVLFPEKFAESAKIFDISEREESELVLANETGHAWFFQKFLNLGGKIALDMGLRNGAQLSDVTIPEIGEAVSDYFSLFANPAAFEIIFQEQLLSTIPEYRASREVLKVGIQEMIADPQFPEQLRAAYGKTNNLWFTSLVRLYWRDNPDRRDTAREIMMNTYAAQLSDIFATLDQLNERFR